MLVIGLGALGCPAAQLLAESGVAHLTLLDPDRVEPSNLHRQMLFSDADLGRPKAVVAREHLAAMGPTTVKAYVEALDCDPLFVTVSGATGVSVAPFCTRTVQKNVPDSVRLAVTVRLRIERR